MHFINDLHPTMLPTFLPEMVSRLGLTLAEAGFLSTLFGVFNLVVQPFAGHFADRLNRPSLALLAPFLTATGACLLPVAPSFRVALLFVSVMGFGTASFHPQGHGLAGLFGGNKNLGLSLAIFAAAGNLGAALSPLYGIFLLGALGPSRMPFAILFVLVVALVARRAVPSGYVDKGRTESASASAHKGETTSGRFFRVFMICLPITLIALIRDTTSQGIRVFLPLLVTGRGGGIELGGAVLFAFTLAGSFSTLVGGRMADIFGKRRVILIMMILAPIFLFPAVKLSGMFSVVLFVLGGACIASTAPVTIAMAQEFVPESRSTASSLVMGVPWGLANIMASPIGKLGDIIGLETALSFVALSPLLVAASMAVGAVFKRARRPEK
jgi:FSR family fosmidomycin resistance protein-like MFS transporter